MTAHKKVISQLQYSDEHSWSVHNVTCTTHVVASVSLDGCDIRLIGGCSMITSAGLASIASLMQLVCLNLGGAAVVSSMLAVQPLHLACVYSVEWLACKHRVCRFGCSSAAIATVPLNGPTQLLRLSHTHVAAQALRCCLAAVALVLRRGRQRHRTAVLS